MHGKFVASFTELAMRNILTEYPNKVVQSLRSIEDLKPPSAMYPIFYGSYDWHSSVHSHWLLVKSVRSYAKDVDTNRILHFLDSQFSAKKAKGELEYLENPTNKGFERPYGWGWFLKLFAEVSLLAKEEAKALEWAKNLKGIADFFAASFKEYLGKADYPIRVGTHFNFSFALLFALEYARLFTDSELEDMIVSKAKQWFLADSNMQVLEPCGDEFLSPVLMEATFMQEVLPLEEFKTFFASFLPDLESKKPATLFTEAKVSDRSDGKIAHLDGVNLSRAWCLRRLSNACDPKLKEILRDNAQKHLDCAIKHIEEDYMGSHWLGSFALLAIDVDLSN